jgi:hypothetical protein
MLLTCYSVALDEPRPLWMFQGPPVGQVGVAGPLAIPALSLCFILCQWK